MVDVLGFQANYTGPYLSDGKFQSSVEFGEKLPIDRWDAFSRLHDSAFKKWDDYGHRTAANSIYNEWMKENPTTSKSIAGFLVLYGNQINSSLSNLGPNMGSLIIGGIKNGYNLADYAMNENKYKREVIDYFKTDPKLGDSRYDPSVWNPTASKVPLAKVDPLRVVGVNKNGNDGAQNTGTVTDPNKLRYPSSKAPSGSEYESLNGDPSLHWTFDRNRRGHFVYNPSLKLRKRKRKYKRLNR